MTSLGTRLRRWFSHDTAFYECRTCGTTLDAEAHLCHQCGSGNISRYDLE
jgi:rRNA maturation endonuclease Nob1